MIRAVIFLVALWFLLVVIVGELYVAAWLAAHGMALATRQPGITAGLALASLDVNRRIVAKAKAERMKWRAVFFGNQVPVTTDRPIQ